MKMMRWRDPIGRYYFFRGLLGRVYLPIMVIYMIDHGLSIEQVALIATCGAIASFVFEVPSGAVADHIGHRRALIVALLGQALTSLCYLGGTFPWILAGAVGYFLFGSLLTGTGEALFFEYLKSEKREAEHLKLSGEGKSFSRIFNILSVLIGGFTYTINPILPFVICSIQFVVAAAVISTFPKAHSSKSVEEKEGFMALMQHFPRAFKTIWNEPRLFWLIIVNGMILGATFASAEFQQVIFQHVGATTAFIGIVYALKRVLSLFISSRVHLMTKYLQPAAMMTCMSAIALSHYLLVPVASAAWTLAIVVLLASLVYAIMEIASNDYMNHIITGASRATTLSVSNFTRTVITAFTAGAIGLLSRALPIEQIFAVIGIVQAIILIFPLVKLAKAYQR